MIVNKYKMLVNESLFRVVFFYFRFIRLKLVLDSILNGCAVGVQRGWGRAYLFEVVTDNIARNVLGGDNQLVPVRLDVVVFGLLDDVQTVEFQPPGDFLFSFENGQRHFQMVVRNKHGQRNQRV